MKKIYIKTNWILISCLFYTWSLSAQTTLVDVNGDNRLDILVVGTTVSIEDNYEAFSPYPIVTQLQNILSADPSINLTINVVAEDIYRTKTVSTGIAGQFTANRDYYCHSLLQYYYWPDDKAGRLDNLAGLKGTDWDYVVICADPYMVANMPGYYSLGLNKVAKTIHSGNAIPLLLLEWTKDAAQIPHFEEFTYRAAQGAVTPVQVVPAGLAWESLPRNLVDTGAIHPTPNGAYTAAAAIYSNLFKSSAANSAYAYNDTIANIVETTRLNAAAQTHFSGPVTFVSPYKSCEISDSNLVYNHGGTSTENGILWGLQWLVWEHQKTLAYRANAPIHFNYGRSSMGSTHLYQIDSARFDYSFGYPLQDDASTGHETMLYGIDKRRNSTDVETDLGTARQMINQSQLPYARSVPLRTIIAQMLEEIPDVRIYPLHDPWHLSNDVNKAIGSYMYTMLTGDCTLPSDRICLDSTQWRSWMAHKIGQETAWNVMHLQGANDCNKVIHNATACNAYQWVNGVTYTSSNIAATHTYTNSFGCDSVVLLNLTIHNLDTAVRQTGLTLTANQVGASYQWIDCSTSMPIAGANSRSYIPTANGDYAVVVTNNGCTDTSSCYSSYVIAVTQTPLDKAIVVYPNPTEANLTIDLGHYEEKITLTVMNALGQEILHKNHFATSIIDLNIEGAAGMYYLTIGNGDKTTVLKVIKQ